MFARQSLVCSTALPIAKLARYFDSATTVAASVPDDGMTVELHAGEPGSNTLENGYAPVVAVFRAPVEGQIRAVFRIGGELVELPLSELERAIKVAKRDVHSEAYFDGPESR